MSKTNFTRVFHLFHYRGVKLTTDNLWDQASNLSAKLALVDKCIFLYEKCEKGSETIDRCLCIDAYHGYHLLIAGQFSLIGCVAVNSQLI